MKDSTQPIESARYLYNLPPPYSSTSYDDDVSRQSLEWTVEHEHRPSGLLSSPNLNTEAS